MGTLCYERGICIPRGVAVSSAPSKKSQHLTMAPTLTWLLLLWRLKVRFILYLLVGRKSQPSWFLCNHNAHYKNEASKWNIGDIKKTTIFNIW